MRRALALVEVKRTDIRAIQSNLSQHFLVKVKAGLGVVMTIHHCHIAGAVVAQWGPNKFLKLCYPHLEARLTNDGSNFSVCQISIGPGKKTKY